jgi:outer membrane lipoprotein-sorting protein
MRKYLWAGALVAGAAFVYAQVGAGQVLANYATALNTAKSLKVQYTVQKVNGAPDNYQLDMAKPNLVRIETPGELIVADGTNIVRYSKGEKTYYKEPQTEESLKGIIAQDQFGLWASFFDPAAFSKVSAKSLGTVNRRGMKLNAIEANYGDGKKKVVYYVSEDKLARQAEISYSDGGSGDTLIVNAKSIELGANANADLFAFNAPAGSRELSMAELNAAKWYTDLEEAKSIAAKTNRKIFVDFMATWCGPCKMLDAEVLQTEGFKKYSSKLVFLRIDVDAQPGVSKAYNVTAMPTQMVLGADGSVIKSTVGYGGPAPFYAFLNGALGL